MSRTWNRLQTRKEQPPQNQPMRPISLEPLEPRLLLSADSIGPAPLSILEAPPVDQAIYVDLHQQNGQVSLAGAGQTSDVSRADSPIVAAALISWDGGGDGTSWHDPLNWSGNVVPGASDDVSINLAGSNPVIRYTAASGTRTVKSVTCNEAFELSGGSLTIAGGASQFTANFSLTGGSLTITGGASQFTSNFSLTGGSLTATGAMTTVTTSLVAGPIVTLTGGSVTATGGASITFPTAPTLTNVSLFATSGGDILFPAATSYSGSNGAHQTVQASGAGSRIDLGHLTTLVGGGYDSYWGRTYYTYLKALDGGEIDVSGDVSGHTAWTLDGAGSVLNVAGVTTLAGAALTAANGAVWVFPAGWQPAWGGGCSLTTTGTGSAFVNQAVLSPSGVSVAINTDAFTNRGVLAPQSGGTLDFNGSLRVDEPGILSGVTGSIYTFSSNLLGDTTNADLYAPLGQVRFDGSGTAASPQQLEVMSRDLGAVAAGFTKNFAYNLISLSNNTYVKLVDLSDNAAGSEPEALYVTSLIVPTGTTLDLNGLHLYARATQISGTVVGGTVTQVPDSGPIVLAAPTPGSIGVAGELDEWTFFGRSGRFVTVAVNPGSGGNPAPLAPYLTWAQVQLLDSGNHVLGTASSTASGQIVSLNGILLPGDGNYKVQVRAPAGHLASTGNYLVTVWDTTPDIATLVLNRQVLGTIENPYSVDRWTFSAPANTQVRFDLVNRSNSSIVFDLTGPGGWVGFSDISADSDLITLPAAGLYTVTAHGTGGLPGGTYTFALNETVVTDLTPGTPYTGAFVGSGQAQLFRIVVPQSSPFRVKLDDSAANNVNELYVKFGASPTRGDYDYRFATPAAADQEILIPMAYAGTWYILVYGNTIRTPGSYTLTGVANSVLLSSVTPDHYATGATATLVLTGAGFDASTSVALVASDSTTYPASSVVVDSFSRMTAVFSLAGMPAAKYSVRASKPGGISSTLPNAFTVTSAGAAQLQTRLILPSWLGYHGTATLYVEYKNIGNEAMPAPLLVLESADPDNSDRPLLTLDQARLGAGFWTSAMPAGFANSVQFLAVGATPGVLQPGESGLVPVYYAGLQQPWNFADRLIEFRVGVLNVANGIVVDWNTLKDAMRPDYVRPDAWDAIWSNLTSQVGATWGSYLAALDENAVYLDELGTPTMEITRLLAFELRQADALNPIRYLAADTDASMPAPGMDLVFSRAYAQPISRRYELGPLGRGWAHNWQLTLATEADGTVKITDMTGTPRIFQPDIRHTGQYLAAPGDQGILTAIGGGVFRLREADGTVYLFRADGKLDYVEDVNHNRITGAYTSGRLTGLSHSSGQALTIAYNAAGRISSVRDGDGRLTVYTYDAANEHLLSVRDYDGRVTNYTYVSGQGLAREHALSTIAYPDGSHRYYTYDTRGRLATTSRDGGAETLAFAYDSTGTVFITDALGNVSRFYFDDWGAILKGTNALGSSVLLSLDDHRNLTSVTDPAGRSYVFQYDAQDNLIRSVDALGHATSFTYTSDYDRLASLTDANGNLTRYSYDAHGNLTAITYANGSHEDWAYDSLGQPTTWINRRGTPLGFTYNADGQITRKTYADGTHVDYVYDARGNLTSATDATGKTTFIYDANDYLTRINYPGGRWLAFTYDTGGRRASSLDQLGHRLTYSYDAVGRLSSITDEASRRIVLYEYDAVGRLQRKTLGNGVYTTYAYDAAGQLLNLVNYKSDATILSRFDYTYDSRGRRTSMGTQDGTWTYEYDDIGQLTHAVFAPAAGSPAPAQNLRYIYDAMGNRVQTVENGVTTNYTTNSLNQYTQVGNTTYIFDADGNLIRETSPSGATVYSYDDENRLIAVQQGADAWTYTYDAFGQRVASSRNGTTTRYMIDPVGLGDVVGEYDSAGNLMARYDYGFGLLSRTASAASAWYIFDAIGNTAALTSATGTTVDSYVYAPFGAVLRQTGSLPNPFQFVGEWGVTSEGEINHMRARYYASSTGRFQSADPLGIVGGDPNLQRYAANSPTQLTDPAGLYWPVVLGGGLIGAGLGAYFYWAQTKACGGGSALGLAGAVVGGAISGATATMGLSTSVLGGALGSMVAAAGDRPSDFNYVVINGGIGAGFGLLKPSAFGLRGNFGAGSPKLSSILLLSGKQGQAMAGGSFAGGAPGFAFCALSRKPVDAPDPDSEDGAGGSSGAAGGVDPNQKLGPAGFGTQGFVREDIAMAYRIDFENDPSATAPAQIVMITDQLDSDLDPSTFALTEIGFGDRLLAIPAGSQHYETTVPMIYNGRTFDVQIEAGIDLATGRFYVNFYSIDPATGLPPDVLTGFLPPEPPHLTDPVADISVPGRGRGMGHVSYTIKAKAALPTGTAIRNIALISFDGQPQIATNQRDPHDPSQGTDPNKECLNTIDAGTPTSRVNPLPAQITTMSFEVSWTGQDNAGGAGIGSYDIYVSHNGGAWALWLSDTAATSATYQASALGTYAFYSRAKDNVGHVEAPPAGADATTEIISAQIAEITVLGNGVSIADGDTTPSLTDYTDFGSVVQGGTPITRTCTVRNDGTATLTLGTVSAPAGFTVTQQPLLTNLLAGQSTTFVVRLETAVVGTKSGDINFTNNDGDGGDGIETPFNFRITGVVLAPGSPEITVLGNGRVIADNDGSPSTLDGTDFGKVAVGSTPITRMFTVRNDGGGTLTLGAVTVPTGFTLVEDPSASLAPGASDTFTVQLNTATAGTYSGYISFGNNDGNENPYNFKITGIVGPEIVVLGNGVSIKDGDTSPSATDGTNFGAAAVDGAPISRTFTIRNDGGGTLTLGTVSAPTGFTVTQQPLLTSLSAGQSTTFVVRLDTAAAGTKTGDVTFTNNDPNESAYNFRITGIVGPEITVLGNGRSIADGDTSPSTTDGTSFGGAAVGGTPVSRTFTIRNDGGGTLTLGTVSAPAGFTVTQQPLLTNLLAGQSTTFVVRLDTALAGTKTGDITFTNNDPNESAYNFRITGIVGPEITVLGNGVSIADGDTSPRTADGTDFGKVAVGSSPITRTFTVRNDGGGTLTLGTVTLPTGFTLVEGLPASLAPGASDTFTVRLDTAVAGTKTGDITFTTNDPNESPYNFRITGVVGPEITVLGNGRSILDGDIGPSTTDGTSFGTVAVGGTPITRTFTVRNDGGGTLLLGSVSVPTGFTLVQPLVASLAPGASATFTVRLDTTLAGTKVGDIIFTTNDPDENPFNFRITGIVTV